ncbi:MAG: alpha/beta hydrolase-fold protein [Ginsengibacter sp.]
MVHSKDPLFIAGNFSAWNPDVKNLEFSEDNNGIAKIVITLSAGNYKYKFTRGSWDKVETTEDGKGVPNRLITVSADTTIMTTIKGWSDDFAAVPLARVHTASPNVTVMDTAFFIPQLNRSRRIWIYLPPDYKYTKKRYPVLYMHDGQNLFDDATSYAGEWGVDKYLDSIFSAGKKDVIVIGIDNGLSKRMSEYNPYSFLQFGKGEGDQYVDFLVKTLKPFVDKNYKTLPGKNNTYIAGSSMGGLISLYAVLKYPAVFGGAGIFSPAFWTAAEIEHTIKSKAKSVNARLFFYAGGEEKDSTIPDMKRIEKEIKAISSSPVKEVIDANAQHNEIAWRKHFPDFYNWTVLGKDD